MTEEIIKEKEAKSTTITEESGATKETEKTYTQKDIDRIVSERLKRAEKDTEKKVQEAERLAKLTADERLKEELKLKEEKAAERERNAARKEMLFEIKDQLDELGIPKKFAEMLVADTAEASKENITNFEKEWKKAIDAAVTAKLKGTTPLGTGIPKAGNESINKMRIAAGLKPL